MLATQKVATDVLRFYKSQNDSRLSLFARLKCHKLRLFAPSHLCAQVMSIAVTLSGLFARICLSTRRADSSSERMEKVTVTLRIRPGTQ